MFGIDRGVWKGGGTSVSLHFVLILKMANPELVTQTSTQIQRFKKRDTCNIYSIIHDYTHYEHTMPVKWRFAVGLWRLCSSSLSRLVHCASTLYRAAGFKATPVQLLSVTYYKQRIFREKAVIVQKCGTNGFVTLLYAFLQCNPYTGPWKLSPIEVLLSSSIKAMFAIELWCYTFSRLYPHPLRLVSYECTTTMAWVMGPKCLFPEQNHCFRGSRRGNFETRTTWRDHCYY